MDTSLAVTVTGPDFDTLSEQVPRAEQLADIIEFRVDLFDSIPVEQLKFLKDRCSLPVLVTLRSHHHGGQFVDDEALRKVYLRHLCTIEPELMDIEYGTPFHEVMELRHLLPRTRFVVSIHDLECFPVDLRSTYQQLMQYPADYYKIAAKAASITDSLRLITFVREMNRVGGKITGIGLGEHGQITRVLAPVMGCPLLFASLDDSCCAAPGQLPIHKLRDTFRVQNHDFNTHMLGLIGNPVSQSCGDVVLNALFAELSLPAVYVKMPVDSASLPTFFAEMRRIGWRGLSVTMPHKEAVIPYLDAVDPCAKAIGAVNTIIAGADGLVGYNFDGVAAWDAIQMAADESLNGRRMVILGAGGAAKAIIYEAKQRGMDVVVVNRTSARGQAVAEALGVSHAPYVELSQLLAQKPAVFVQATSVGKEPDTLVDAHDLSPETIVFDVTITPPMTLLLRQAKLRGCRVVTGREMWWRQALMQVQLWFGGSLPDALVRDSLLKHMETPT